QRARGLGDGSRAARTDSSGWGLVAVTRFPTARRRFMSKKIEKTEEEWKKTLTPEQYHVLREKGTERPFTGEYADSHDDGMYRCAGCGNPLFSSDTKYESGSGWPSFYQPIEPDAVATESDRKFGMTRTEVL